MNVVDSSGWMEYFTQSRNANIFQEPVEAISLMQLGYVVSLDETLSIQAAKISLELKIPMADSIILATARAYKATLWTQDIDFKGLAGVKFIPSKKS